MLTPQFNFYLLMFIKRPQKENQDFSSNPKELMVKISPPTDEVVQTLSFCEVYFYHDLLCLSPNPLGSQNSYNSELGSCFSLYWHMLP